MYTVCLGSVSSITMPRLPAWFSTTHLRPASSSKRGGAHGAAPALPPPVTAAAPFADALTGTTPLRSARFFVFMSSVTRFNPEVAASPCETNQRQRKAQVSHMMAISNQHCTSSSTCWCYTLPTTSTGGVRGAKRVKASGHLYIGQPAVKLRMSVHAHPVQLRQELAFGVTAAA